MFTGALADMTAISDNPERDFFFVALRAISEIEAAITLNKLFAVKVKNEVVRNKIVSIRKDGKNCRSNPP